MSENNNFDNEVWKPIPGCPGYYASTSGKIGSGKVQKGREWVDSGNVVRVLSPSSDSGGYQQVTLSLDGVARSFTVHTLVAKTFLGERPDDQVVRLLDGNRSNPALENLEYQERTYPKPGGSRALTDKEAHDARTLFNEGKATVDELSEKYNVSKVVIWRIVFGHTYQDVGGPISTPTHASPDSEYLSDKDVRKMRKMRHEGKSYTFLADKFGVSLSTASRICRGLRRREAGGIIVT